MADKKDELLNKEQAQNEGGAPDTEKQTPEKPADKKPKLSEAEEKAAWLEEYVPIRLFKDADRYVDDVFVCVNGEACQIQRGVDVTIRRKFALVLANSRTQDEAAARMAAEFAAAGE